MLFAYHFAWTLFFILLLPFTPFLKNHRMVQRLTAAPAPRRAGRKTIWVHALSVGEVLSALPLIRSLRKEFPQEEVVFTVTTRQGMETAQRALQSDGLLLLPMPLDFWRPMLRMIRRIRPKLFILVETDLWPGLMDHLTRRGVKTMLVNGRVSPGTLNSYRRFRFFFGKMLGMFHACLMQTELDRTRLLVTGVKAEKVRSLGNMKFDRPSSPMDEKGAGTGSKHSIFPLATKYGSPGAPIGAKKKSSSMSSTKSSLLIRACGLLSLPGARNGRKRFNDSGKAKGSKPP